MPWRITVVDARRQVHDITDAVIAQPSKTQLTAADVKAAIKNFEPEYICIEHTGEPHWRPLTIAYGAPFTLSLQEPSSYRAHKIALVYFINCYINKNFIYLFRNQMRDLYATRILTESPATLHITSSGTRADSEALQKEAKNIFADCGIIRFDHTEENLFEYPGIHRVWEIGQQNNSTYVLYFHARGISRIKLGRFRRNRQSVEKRLFRRVIGDWRENLLWLSALPTSDKIGLTQGGNGWLWYNFWWAKTAYIARLEEPERTNRRHYYEDWLARVIDGTQQPEPENLRNYPDTMDKCISIAAAPRWKKYHIGSDFHPGRGETHMGLSFYALRRIGYNIAKFLKLR